MDFKERSFRGNQSSLPTPECYFDGQERLLVVVTGWGAPGAAKKFTKTLVEYFLSARGDRDATSPFPKLPHLSTNANNLRIAALVANELHYRENNRESYSSGLELFAASQTEREITWVQTGNPSIMIHREGLPLLPVSINFSLSNEMAKPNQNLPPLPTELLGLSMDPVLKVQSLCLRPEDKFVLLSRSWVPSQLFEESLNSFEKISKSLIGDGQEPFWLGYWSI